MNLPNAPYDYSVTYDSAAHIQRVTVDPMGRNADIFIEIPVFPETGAGYQKINAFFREKRDSFLMDAGGDIAMLLELASGSSGLHADTQEVRIEHPMDGVVSVLYTICWDAGGQVYYDNESYLFNTETGSALKLADLIDGSEAEIKAGILADVRNAITDVPALQGWALEDFDFYIENGQIWITFGRTELPGIGGAPDVPLSAPLHLGGQ